MEDNSPDAVAELTDWYQRLSSRTVDLIGDYAGNELFLVEGDSLILHCLENKDIDLDDGLQLLHAVFAVESFLAALLQRKANFHIAFFDDHAELCIPHFSKPKNAFKYRLVRAVVIRHLQTNLPKQHPRIAVDRFQSYEDPDFSDSLKDGVFFVMCHDGAASSPKFTPATETTEHHATQKLAFRRMIHWFVGHGLNIALTNSVTWQDTKIMAMVLEGSRRSTQANLRIPCPTSAAAPPKPDVDLRKLLEDIKSDLQSEALLTVFCVSKLLLTSDPTRRKDVEALVISAILCKQVPLAQRRLRKQASSKDDFLKVFADATSSLLTNPEWSRTLAQRGVECDIADVIDGRLFNHIRLLSEQGISASTNVSLSPQLSEALSALSLEDLSSGTGKGESSASQAESTDVPTEASTPVHTLYPFNNSVFDEHLASTKIEVNDEEPVPSQSTTRTFRELTHWHNTRPVTSQGKIVLTDWQKARMLRSHQVFLREMQQYAASLTNSVGKALEPEIIFMGQSAKVDAPSAGTAANATKVANAARLATKNEQRFVSAWQSQLKDLEKIDDPQSRCLQAQAYLNSSPHDRVQVLGPEITLYILNNLLRIWTGVCKNGMQNDSRSARFAALIFNTLNQSHANIDGLDRTIRKCLQLTNDSLGLTFDFATKAATSERQLCFTFPLSQSDPSLRVPRSALLFQLEHCGPYLDRGIDSAPDPRVRFQPDAWQRRVLDLIDQKRSAFVVAPTSAGKTFISFYAMKQILRESDDGVLVYVAPTKALVNQIAAELQAQYSKKYKYAGKSVWAIHTRDYRINDPQGCQILVTVPHVLQIMLLAPNHAKPSGWANRVKRIIFDEIHSIGAAEDGIVWEQLLLLAPCPIIALSATVGNPHQFHEWMKSTQAAMGLEMEIVQHPYRYSDLRKFIYEPPKTFDFQMLADADAIGLQSLDGAHGMLHLHPVASLINESRGMPDDLHLEARDCLSLWQCMKAHATADYPLDSALDPLKALPSVVRKIDVLNWEAALKAVLKAWMTDTGSPFHAVREDLAKPLFADQVSNGNKDDGVNNASKVDQNDLLSTTLPLLSSLASRNALPAILFNYDRTMCESICKALMAQLGEAQASWKATNVKWKQRLEKFEKWKKDQEKVKSKRSAPKKGKTKNKGDDEESVSKADRERDSAEAESNSFASFDPDEIVDGFSFANRKALMPSEFEELKRKLEWRHVSPWLIDALQLGIGVHHAGMNRSYRQAVEMLFRRGFLRVVIATGTLALGINMPCKTVVFSGDSIFLTALNFRQAAGRAGRRGFDLLGNVVFQNISREKVFRLMSSRLPDLNGHFPITTSLVLRLFTLLHGSENSPYAKKAINTLLSQPRLYLGGENFRDQVLHHLRYSIEYLRRQHLISATGKPINFAGTVSHLYYTESSSFAFHCLLKDGYFNRLCAEFQKGATSEERILNTLMLVMAHIFGRRPCRRADREFVDTVVKASSSNVFLPNMPSDAERCLRQHNADTLSIFYAYVKTFAEQHATKLGIDHTLPLTKVQFGGGDGAELSQALGDKALPPTTVRSAFVALSGHGDDFGTISELCRTARTGIWLEEAVIPHVALYPDETQAPVNAYLYDFYKHGDITALEKANGIRRGDVWFLLNDFSLVLATVVTSFKNFMNVSVDADLDMVEVVGGGDMHEMNEDQRVASLEAGSDTASSKAALPMGQTAGGTQALAGSGPPTAQKKKKAVVQGSWEDQADDDNALEAESQATTASSVHSDWGSDSEEDDAATQTSYTGASSAPAWDEDSGDGLRKVALAFEALKKSFDERFKKMWA